MATISVRWLVVAGGGGAYVSGAGGGGVLSSDVLGNDTLDLDTSYDVVVGLGGLSMPLGSSTAGGNSSFNGHVSIGGGRGVSNAAGGNGGSGGGGSKNSAVTNNPGGTGTAGQGNNGGLGLTNGSGFQGAGGGGGAGGAGGNGSAPGSTGVGGNGGAGVSNDITGTAIFYGAGGGGWGATTRGTGGSGVGGNAVLNSAQNNLNGPSVANSGAGAGGGGGTITSLAPGADGKVVVRYTGAQQFIGGVVTTVGADTVHTFLTSGRLIPYNNVQTVDWLLAGQGGGAITGGGGGGDVKTSADLGTMDLDISQTYDVTVGVYGLGSALAGESSVFNGQTAKGGGRGGSGGASGAGAANGAANGGGGGNAASFTAGGAGDTGGFAGGTGASSPQAGGGGGGDTVAGGNASAGTGGSGGAGRTSSITGTPTVFGSGGGGYGSSVAGTSGTGAGPASTATPGGTLDSLGMASQFVGAGSGGSFRSAAVQGGTGRAVIRYPAPQKWVGGYTYVDGSDIVHDFRATGQLRPIADVPAAGPPMTSGFRAAYSAAPAAISHTFTAADLGAADAGRTILLGLAMVASAATVTVTIGGVAATLLAQHSASNLRYYTATVPTGTTGDIVVTLSTGTISVIHAGVWRLLDVDLTTGVLDTYESTLGTNRLGAVTGVGGGRAFAMVMAVNSAQVFDLVPFFVAGAATEGDTATLYQSSARHSHALYGQWETTGLTDEPVGFHAMAMTALPSLTIALGGKLAEPDLTIDGTLQAVTGAVSIDSRTKLSSGPSAPVFTRASSKVVRRAGVTSLIGNDVLPLVDGGVLLEVAATNLHTNGVDLNSYYSTIVGVTKAKDAVDPLGNANSATTITDANTATSTDRAQRNETITAGDTQTRTYSLFVKKTIGTPTEFSSYTLEYTSGGTTHNLRVVLNATTGEWNTACNVAHTLLSGTYGTDVEDWGDYWRVIVTLTANGTANVTCDVQIAPNYNLNGGPVFQNVNATGVVVATWSQLELGARASSPIITPTMAATRAADVMTLPFPAGTYDVTVTFDDGTTQVFAAQSGAGGWSVPVSSLTRPLVARIDLSGGAGSWDFATESYTVAASTQGIKGDSYDTRTKVGKASAAFSFSRSTHKYAQKLDGNWERFAANVLAKTDKGINIEPIASGVTLNAWGNYDGAKIGTIIVAGSGIGATGSHPKGANRPSGTGITFEIVGLDPLDGLPAIQYRVSGTNSGGSTAFVDYYFMRGGESWFPTILPQPAVQGETFTFRLYAAQVVAGAHTGFVNTSARSVGLAENSAAGAYLGEGGTNNGISSTKRMIQGTRTLLFPTAAALNAYISNAVTAGGTVDITVSIATAELRKVGSFFANETPFPTEGVALQRAADVLTLPFPDGTHTVTVTFDDNSTQVLTGQSGGAWTVPTNLNRQVIKSISLGGGRGLWDFINDVYWTDAASMQALTMSASVANGLDITVAAANLQAVTGALSLDSRTKLTVAAGNLQAVTAAATLVNKLAMTVVGDVAAVTGALSFDSRTKMTVAGDLQAVTSNFTLANKLAMTITGDLQAVTGAMTMTNGLDITVSADIAALTAAATLTNKLQISTGGTDIAAVTAAVAIENGLALTMPLDIAGVTSDIALMTTQLLAIAGDIAAVDGSMALGFGEATISAGDLNIAGVTGLLEMLTTELLAIEGDLGAVSADLTMEITNVLTMDADVAGVTAEADLVVGPAIEITGDIAAVDGSAEFTANLALAIEGDLGAVTGEAELLAILALTMEATVAAVDGALDLTNALELDLTGDIAAVTLEATLSVMEGNALDIIGDLQAVTGEALFNARMDLTMELDLAAVTAEVEFNVGAGLEIIGDIAAVTAEAELFTPFPGVTMTINGTVAGLTGLTDPATDDIRERILARLAIVLAAIPGVATFGRNDPNVPESAMPGILLLDGDEFASEERHGNGGKPAFPQVISMAPEIYVMVQEDPENVGPVLNELLESILAAVLADAELTALCHNGDIRFEGIQNSLAIGRTMAGEMGVNFTFNYALRPVGFEHVSLVSPSDTPKREQILAALFRALSSVPGVQWKVRNDTNTPETLLPAVILLDGDETVREPLTYGRGSRPAVRPQFMRMTPEVYGLVMDEGALTGYRLNALRLSVINHVLGDPTLNSLVMDRDIRYEGLQTGFALGRSMAGEMGLMFAFNYTP